MALLLPTQSTVLNAYAVLIDSTPGYTAFTDHQNYIKANGIAGYTSALSTIFAGYSNAQLANLLVTNLGLGGIVSLADATAYLAANASDRVGAMIKGADMLLNYVGTDAAILAAQDAYAEQINASYVYSSDADNVATMDLDDLMAPVTDFMLSAAADRGADFVGTSGADMFHAPLDVNGDGLTVNSLQSADVLNGAGGRDQLWADLIQENATIGRSGEDSGGERAIEPTTTSIEELYFNARETSLDPLGVYWQQVVTINGRKMIDFDYIESHYSDADLTVRGLTTNRSDGGHTKFTDMTVSMDHTSGITAPTGAWGEDQHHYAWDNEEPDLENYYINGKFGPASMKVLFEQNYLNPEIRTDGGELYIELMDMDAALTGQSPLLDNPFGAISFSMGDPGNVKILNFGTDADTYPDLLQDIRDAIAAAAVTDPMFAQLTADFGPDFTATDTDTDPGGSIQGRTIVITNSGPEALNAISMQATGVQPAGKDFHTGFSSAPPGTVVNPLEINVDLEKVGRGEDGGGLIIGGDNYTKGFDVFNVTVKGNADMPSSLAYLLTTPHGELETLNITSETRSDNSYADLQIGNSNTPIYSVLDLNNLNATTFKGDLKIGGADVVSGGMYDYNFGGGNDTLELDIFNFVHISPGGVKFDIDMGAGNDYVDATLDGDAVDTIGDYFKVVTGSGDDTVDMYMDSGVSYRTMAQLWHSDYLRIDTGAGADNVYLGAYGTFLVTAGGDSDFVNVEDDGSHGFWAFGAETAAQPFVARVLYKAQMTVSFAGFESTVNVTTTSANNFVAKQMDINAAIIAAIQASPELSRLLSYRLTTDNQALEVSSRIGGENELAIALYQPELVETQTGILDGQVVLASADLSAIRQGLINTTALISTDLETVAEVVSEVGTAGTIASDWFGSLDQTGAGDEERYAYRTHDVANDVGTNGSDVDTASNSAQNNDIFDLAGADLFLDYDDGGSSQSIHDGVSFARINMGNGSNDLVVLHSDPNSSNILIINDVFGKVSVVNFHDVPNDQVDSRADVANHALDFTTFLNNQYDPSDNSPNSQSVEKLAVTLNIVDGAEPFADGADLTNGIFNDNSARANQVSIIRFQSDNEDTPSESFAALSAATLVNALNGDWTDGSYGNLGDALLEALAFNPADWGLGGDDTLVGLLQKHIIMVENGMNEGEYKVFSVTSSIDGSTGVVTDGDFNTTGTGAPVLLGTLDFGASINVQLVGSAAYSTLLKAMLFNADDGYLV